MSFGDDASGLPAGNGEMLPEQVRADLRAGVAAARGGQRALARELLARVVQHDERNLTAWLWLSQVVDGRIEREICLENVLTLDPGNEVARQGLAELQAQAGSVAGLPEGAPRTSPSPAEEAIAAVPVRPAPPGVAADYGEAYLCPYCAAPTHPQHRHCPTCGSKLWVRSRQQEQSAKVGIVLLLQAVCAGLNLAAIGVVLAYEVARLGAGDFAALLQVFLGLPSEASPELAERAMQLVPRPIFFALLFFLLLSLVALVGTYLRWKPALFLLLLNGAWLVVAGVMMTVLLWQTAGGEDATRTLAARVAMLVLDAIILLVVLGLVLEVRSDLFVEQKRLTFHLDRGAVAGVDFLVHGQRYLREGMWALAALHLKRAVDQLPDSCTAQVQLALALGHLKEYDAAARHLEEARRMRPQDPRIGQLEEWLQGQR